MRRRKVLDVYLRMRMGEGEKKFVKEIEKEELEVGNEKCGVRG